MGSVPTIEKICKGDRGLQKNSKLGIKGEKDRRAANADTPDGAILAAQYGAEGIGLCRTERMFNGEDRIQLFVDMIMAKDDSDVAAGT